MRDIWVKLIAELTDALHTGLLGFPPKSLQYEFLCKFKPVFYIRQRDYSKANPPSTLGTGAAMPCSDYLHLDKKYCKLTSISMLCICRRCLLPHSFSTTVERSSASTLVCGRSC